MSKELTEVRETNRYDRSKHGNTVASSWQAKKKWSLFKNAKPLSFGFVGTQNNINNIYIYIYIYIYIFVDSLAVV